MLDFRWHFTRRLAIRALLVLGLLLASNLAASEARTRPPDRPRPSLEVQAPIDGPLIALSLGLWLLPSALGDADDLPPPATYDEDSLNALDRMVVGNHNRPARLASDIGSVAVPLAAALANLGDLPLTGWKGVAVDTALLAEAMTLSGASWQLARHAFGRPRPFLYEEAWAGRQSTDPEDHLSFFSGHTTTVFAAATAFATIFTIRRTGALAKALVWIAAVALGAAEATLRVIAGRHFWTDAFGGAIAGTSFGVLVPVLHRVAPAGAGCLQASPSGISWTKRF